ncbi:uncharacterized protein LOC143146101 [Ptiloglossa arizonensis]|uniref:uncharacterized protein LOC143146101 n=1 Tax=Ptiloglossa arizonensis TaxID=3350558 RepID=UPI003FA0ACCE
MLEPLIVLTVLNCLFMFSSTVTTCALWWQYRSHRCCFKKDTNSQPTRDSPTKMKYSSTCKATKKPPGHTRDEDGGCGALKQTVNSGPRSLERIKSSSMERSKSNSVISRENKNKRTSKLKTKSNSNLKQASMVSEEQMTSLETIGTWDLENKIRASEASQTFNDGKSAVVMEYSTVQKIVQIIDNDTDLAATKLVIKDLKTKPNGEKRFDSGSEAKEFQSAIVAGVDLLRTTDESWEATNVQIPVQLFLM